MEAGKPVSWQGEGSMPASWEICTGSQEMSPGWKWGLKLSRRKTQQPNLLWGKKIPKSSFFKKISSLQSSPPVFLLRYFGRNPQVDFHAQNPADSVQLDIPTQVHYIIFNFKSITGLESTTALCVLITCHQKSLEDRYFTTLWFFQERAYIIFTCIISKKKPDQRW